MLSKLQLRPDSYSAANQLFGSSVDKFSGAMQQYGDRIKNRAVNELLSGYETNADNAIAGHNDLTSQLAGIGGITPTEALGLADKAYNPVYKQMSFDKGQYGFQTDELGNAYSFNKNDGNYTQVADSPYSGGINPKNIMLKPVTSRDGYGNETTTQVPFNKLTGQPVGNTATPTATDLGVQAGEYLANKYGIETEEQFRALPQEQQTKLQGELEQILNPTAGNAVGNPPMNAGVGVKAPTLSQADRDAASATTNALKLLDTAGGQYRPGIVGGMDSGIAFGKNMVGMNSKDTTDNRVLNSTLQNLKANLTAALIKGVPSDKDMKVIEDMLPSVWDNENTFAGKMENVRNILTKQAQTTKTNILDPRQQGGIVPPMEAPKAKAPDVQRKQTSKSGKPMILVDGEWYYE